MVLAEDHLLFRPVLSAPGADAALQRAAQAIQVAIGVAKLHFFQHRHRPHAGTDGEQPSALTRIDPLLLMETDPAGAHEFVVRWPDRPVAGVVGGKFSLA